MWAFGVIMELLLALIIAAFIATQIVWPALTKQPLFPTFRKRDRELHGVDEQIHDAELDLIIQKKRQELEELERRAANLKEGRKKP
jgi:hypothetical protein